ncbi:MULTISPECIES: hypothetical protein [unclassified Massilia]|uniref:hypothetical protein n=1 Tax=unclassified Massilia TaxID=2609279 RepID=UPI001AEDEFD1|nr:MULTISPECIES: hypothetical protein [unclassified Massilia]
MARDDIHIPRPRLLVAFATAPLVAVLALALADIVQGRTNWRLSLGLIPILYIFAAISSLGVAVPAYFLLSRYRLVNFFTIFLAGLVVPVVVAAILRLPNPLNPDDLSGMVPAGALSACVFWAMWRRARMEQAGRQAH